jgi:hypothetical protein
MAEAEAVIGFGDQDAGEAEFGEGFHRSREKPVASLASRSSACG